MLYSYCQNIIVISLPLLTGSNGHEFMFLLKGHEDLRQDERVMQLFGLVNTLLANDPASLRKNLRHVSLVGLSTANTKNSPLEHVCAMCPNGFSFSLSTFYWL